MRIQTIHIAASLLCCALCAPAAPAQAPVPDSPAIEHQIDGMLARMTLQQKLEIIGGVDSMFIRAEPSAGFPSLKMSDGPEGVRTWGPDTAYAGGIALAAAWDRKLADEMGVSIARDARARGVHFLLGPGVDIYRAPMCGRNFEYFGEDPYLSGRTAAAYIQGVQSQGVIATVKHFDANNEEYDRHNVSSDMDERTLREIYLPAFEAAVKQGGVGAVMNSYNLLNGVHATQNKHLNLDILKGDWKFNGILMSDWDATYSAVGAANGGLDLEMPSGKFMNPENLLPAIKDGQVSEATIDDKVRRIFRDAIRFGFLNRDQTELEISRYNQQGRDVALQEALESITLLKNEGKLLPLDANSVHTIAVIGPDAWPAVPGGGGSSQVDAYAPVSFMTGLSDALAGKVKVLYSAGLPTAEELMSETAFSSPSASEASGGGPVRVEVFKDPDLSDPSHVFYTDHIASYSPGEWTPPSGNHRSVRYTTQYHPGTSGEYLFLVGADGSDAYKLIVNGRAVIDQTPHEGQAPRYVELSLTAGQPASIELDYWPDSGEARIGLGIRAVDQLVSPQAKRIASMADVALIAVGFNPTEESEGFDRTFELPFGQDELIQSIARANPHTIVTITAGGSVDMHRWLGSVPVLLHNWYPGQEGGRALTRILFGEHDPEGHLPVSFERSWDQNPTHDSYYAASVPRGQTPRVFYKEGVFLGYRYYTTNNIQPLFPFGFGLSYTTFSFSNLQVAPAAIGEDNQPASGYKVSFDVTNTGQRAGATVAQVYVGDPSARVKRPVRELKGYEKVRLAPGETKHVSVTLNQRSLAYWSDQEHGWQVDPGQFVVYVGDSSENTPLTRNFQVE